jgi:DNA-binding NtrC family response regulator
MRHPQVLIYERDGSLARRLRPICQEAARAWALHEPRKPAACLELLQTDTPAVLVLKLGRDLVGEVALLERVAWLHPDVPVIVVADVEDTVLADVAWDLGATYVHMPPEPRDHVIDVVTSLMQSAMAQVGEGSKRFHA